MGLLKEFEQQYSILTAEITSNIGRLATATGDEKRQLISAINKGMDEAQELIEQMGLEIREESNPTTRSSCQTRLNCYQAELKRLQEEYNQTKSRKSETIDIDYDFDEISIQEDQKRRLLDNSERLERTGKHLQEGYRIAVETEQIGAQVLTNLAQQRETIKNSRSRLRETNSELGRSSRLMNMMIIRGLRDKFILYGICFVFVLVISLSIYFSLS